MDVHGYQDTQSISMDGPRSSHPYPSRWMDIHGWWIFIHPFRALRKSVHLASHRTLVPMLCATCEKILSLLREVVPTEFPKGLQSRPSQYYVQGLSLLFRYRVCPPEEMVSRRLGWQSTTRRECSEFPSDIPRLMSDADCYSMRVKAARTSWMG